MPEDAKQQSDQDEGAKKEEPKAAGKAKGKQEDALGALRASLSGQLDGLRNQNTALEARVAEYEAKDAEITAKLDAASLTDDPEKLTQRVVELSGENAQLKQRAEQWGHKGLDYAAEAKAAQILLGESTEHLGSLVQRLKSANTESDMETIAMAIRSELQALSKLAPSKDADLPDDIDGGTSSAGRSDVLSDMKETRPEDWAKKREGFRERIFGS